MIHRILVATVLATLLCACASSRQDPALAQNAPAPTQPAQTQSWMKSSDYNVDGPVPAMDRSRKVNEQDCNQPIDLTAGNLRCK
ncbi:MAG: hypothetical protein ABR570_07885 [Burkholderiales bacterium]